MAMVCPQCDSSFDQRLQCPTCGVRLAYQTAKRASVGDLMGPNGQWQQTPWGRIVVGLLLAQGLYYGLWHLITAGMLATSDEGQGVWTQLHGVVLSQCLQALSLVLGGMLTGAGQR